MTTLSQRLDDYLALRRSLGYDLSSSGRVLRRFTAFAGRAGADHVTTDLFLRWKAAFGSASNNTWAARLGVVRLFAGWLRGYDERTEVPPPGLIPSKFWRARPYIYSDMEVVKIVAHAARLPSRYGLRGWTCSTLFGLIAVTGLRVGEAVGLNEADVDLDEGIVTVKRGKNGKARFVPIAPSTIDRLRAYWAERTRLSEWWRIWRMRRLLLETLAPFPRKQGGRRVRPKRPAVQGGLHPLGPKRSGGCGAQAKHCGPPRRA